MMRDHYLKRRLLFPGTRVVCRHLQFFELEFIPLFTFSTELIIDLFKLQ